MNLKKFFRSLEVSLFSRWGLEPGSIIHYDVFSNVRIYSFFFDVFEEEEELNVEMCGMLFDLAFNKLRPSYFKYDFVYRGKERVKVLVMQSRIAKKYRSLQVLLKEIYYFVLPRYYYSHMRKLYFTNFGILDLFGLRGFVNFTLSSYLFIYLLDEIDPSVLRSLRLNFSISLFSRRKKAPSYLYNRVGVFMMSFLFYAKFSFVSDFPIF